MLNIKQIFFFIALFMISLCSYSNQIFPFTIDESNVLTYKQTKSLSTLNFLLTQTISSKKLAPYLIEYDTINTNPKKYIFLKNKIIFYNDPKIILTQKKIFQDITVNLITNALDIDKSNFNTQNINWIITALRSRFNMLTSDHHIPLKASFPSVHYMLISGIKLNPKSILKSQLCNTSGFTHEIYSEICSILLISILKQKNGKQIISDYISAASNNVETEEKTMLLYKAINANIDKNKLHSDISPEKHFLAFLNKTAQDYSINSYMPPSPEFTLKKFEKTNNIQFKLKESSNSFKTCSLKNITKNIDRMDSPIRKLKSIRSNLNYLHSYSPHYMKSPIQDISKNILKLTNSLKKEITVDKFDKIQLSINNSINKLYKSVAIQDKLNKLMFTSEIEYFNTEKRFSRQFEIINKYNSNNENLYPELNKYLDNLDETFR